MTRTLAIIMGLGLALVPACKGKSSGEKDHAGEHANDDKGHGAKGHDEEDHEENGHEEGHDEGMVTLTPEQSATAKIAFANVETRAVSSEMAATGELVPPDDGVARVGPKLAGRVTRLNAGVGDRVKRGQVLGIIDSPELGRAKADYVAAASAAKVARETADRERALWEKQISSERDYRAAEAEATKTRAEKEAAEVLLHTLGLSDAQLARLTADQHQTSAVPLVSPIEGVIVERPVTLGQMIDPSVTTFVVMDLRRVWVQVDVYERDLAQVKVGGKVEVRVKAWADRTFTGTIESIGAVVESRTRTIKVRVAIENADGALKPGMFAAVKLAGTAGEAREGLFVPAAAVQRDGDDAIVFVPVGEHQFQLRKIEIGVRSSDWIEVLRGLAAGERVVTAGAFQLKSEARRESFGGHEH
jgi:cobalt-zinc-cadmium efflux system membrane fusion protein